jgi:hypothetical protein
MIFKTAAATVVALALSAAPAHASVWLSKDDAEANTRSYVEETYASEEPSAYCRPQGYNVAKRGYVYKRWVCGWADEYGCEGRLLIRGARGNYYYAKVLRGQRCPT